MQMRHVYQPPHPLRLTQAVRPTFVRSLQTLLPRTSIFATSKNALRPCRSRCCGVTACAATKTASSRLTSEPLFNEQLSVRPVSSGSQRSWSSGVGAWNQGALNIEPVGESLRFEILKRDRVCQLCGAGRNDVVLEVDHIVPRSRVGRTIPTIFKFFAHAVTEETTEMTPTSAENLLRTLSEGFTVFRLATSVVAERCGWCIRSGKIGWSTSA